MAEDGAGQGTTGTKGDAWRMLFFAVLLGGVGFTYIAFKEGRIPYSPADILLGALGVVWELLKLINWTLIVVVLAGWRALSLLEAIRDSLRRIEKS